MSSNFSISTDKKLLQLEKVHRFLSQEAYWCLGVPFETVSKAAGHSLTFGVYTDQQTQIGYARVVTDYTTIAWICDVYIEEAYRGNGLSRNLMEAIMQELAPLKLRRICLATKDAHQLYHQFGFKVTETPQNWMEIKNNSIYL